MAEHFSSIEEFEEMFPNAIKIMHTEIRPRFKTKVYKSHEDHPDCVYLLENEIWLLSLYSDDNDWRPEVVDVDGVVKYFNGISFTFMPVFDL